MDMIKALDPHGQPISVQRETSVAAVAGFVLGFLAYEPRILDILPAAQLDDSLVVQSYAAVLQMFAEAPDGAMAARAHLERAARAALPSTARERRLALAVTQWVEADVREAIDTLEALVEHHPRDLAALKLAQYLAFNLGDSPAMLRLALRAASEAQDNAHWHGMLAFAYEQCHFLSQAQAAARRALAIRPDEPWAQHALAHVMLTDGRLREGVEFMESASGGWAGLTSFMRTHNWWHLAVFHIELGDAPHALRLYDEQVWGVDPSYSQDQVGAVSLLARLELAGADVGDRWTELANWLARRVADQVQPFLDLQYLYGLARAGRAEALELQAHIEQFAPRSPLASRAAWTEVCVPACRGLLAHAQGRWSHAAQALDAALPQLVRIGGSHAQRDLFEQIRIDAMQRAGHLAGAHNLLQPQANAQPQSVRLRRRLRTVDEGLGLGAIAADPAHAPT